VAEVALVDVSKSFGAVEAVRGLSLSIADGEFVVLLGPTGAGKTTTLRLIAGLARPDRGNVVIQGRVVTDEVPAERDVAFVFQQYSLYPHLTVYDNLAFPLRSPARRMNEEVVRRRVHQVAELLHIEQKLGNRATALSGGAAEMKLGRLWPRASPYKVNCETTRELPCTSRSERFILPWASSKMRRLATFSAIDAVTCDVSSRPTPSSTINPAPISPVTRPSNVTRARLTLCTTARIVEVAISVQRVAKKFWLRSFTESFRIGSG